MTLRTANWPSVATRVGVYLLLALVLSAQAAWGQLLPGPFTTPVMDVLRREAAAEYAEDREIEVAQKVLERIYDEMNGLGVPAYEWRETQRVLDDVQTVIESGADLGYRAADLAERIHGLFQAQQGENLVANRAVRWQALLDTYRAMATTGVHFANDLEAASQTVETIRAQVETIGQGFFGLTELGSHQQSAQTETMTAILAAEEMVRMRAHVALQVNADILSFMERIAQDREREILTYCLLTGKGCPDRPTEAGDTFPEIPLIVKPLPPPDSP